MTSSTCSAEDFKMRLRRGSLFVFDDRKYFFLLKCQLTAAPPSSWLQYLRPVGLPADFLVDATDQCSVF